MTKIPKLLLAAGLAVALATLGGCTVNFDVAKREYLKKGDAFAAQKKYSEAIIEYRNALKRDPKFGEAHYGLAQAYGAMGDTEHALPSYLRAADLLPDSTEAQLNAGYVLLLARRYIDAKTKARSILARDSSNVSALVLLGDAQGGLKVYDEAVAANRRAVALDPTHAGIYINLGSMEYVQGNIQEAEAAFKAAVLADGTSVQARVSLADFYGLAGRPADAEKTYQEALKIDPANVVANRAIATFYIQSGRMAQAEEFLKKVASTLKTPDGIFDLADYYVAVGRRRDALALLNVLKTRETTFAEASVKIALIAYIEGYRTEAVKVLDEALAKKPKNAPALALKAHILLAQRRRPEAIAAAQAAVAADSKFAGAQYALGVVARATGETESARDAFLTVLKLDPNQVEALVALADLNLETHQIDSAKMFADQAVKASPHLVAAHLALAKVLASRSDTESKAQIELATLQKDNPTSVDVQVEIGRLALVKRDEAGATRAFTRALELDPNALDPLIELTKMDLQADRIPQARKRVDAALVKHPESPVLLLISGKAYASIDGATSEKYLIKTIQLDPSNIDAYETLAALYLGHHRIDQAKAQFVALSEQQPTSDAPRTMVGILSETQGNQAEAERWYKEALKVNLRAATAGNNLAWLYAQRGENLDKALELAQMAHAELPTQLDVTDTLGYVYLKRNMAGMAVTMLRNCVDVARDNPLYLYHLGLAYAQNGEDAKARISLQKTLALNPTSPYAGDAKKALSRLLY